MDNMLKFLRSIKNRQLLTEFITNIFDYQNITKYNYIYRQIEENNQVILDIYDNVSNQRFNRYIFDYNKDKYIRDLSKENNVYITKININNLDNPQNKLEMFAYLFKLKNKDNLIEYAHSFLNKEFIIILNNIIK